MLCYLDMDGVLADFPGGALRRHRFRDYFRDGSTPRGRGLWDMARHMGLGEAEFWRGIDDYEFWSGLEPMPEARAIVELVEEHCAEHEITVLTAPSVHPDCRPGKLDWLRRHFPQLSTRVLFDAQKARYAGPDALLVDDGQHNVDAFRAARGSAWLVPRPWNDDWEQEPFLLERLAEFLDAAHRRRRRA